MILIACQTWFAGKSTIEFVDFRIQPWSDSGFSAMFDYRRVVIFSVYQYWFSIAMFVIAMDFQLFQLSFFDFFNQ